MYMIIEKFLLFQKIFQTYVIEFRRRNQSSINRMFQKIAKKAKLWLVLFIFIIELSNNANGTGW